MSYLKVVDAKRFQRKADYYLPTLPGLDLKAMLDRLISDYADLKRFYEANK